MFAVLMATFALVIAVVALGGVLLITSRVAATWKATDSRLTNIRTEITNTSTAKLRAEVDDLRGALDVIRASNRKEFGALWGRMGGRGQNSGKVFDGASGLPLADDDELEAVLALQSAKPVQPQ